MFGKKNPESPKKVGRRRQKLDVEREVLCLSARDLRGLPEKGEGKGGETGDLKRDGAPQVGKKA